MVIFHSYVNLPEGRVYKHYGINNIRDYGDDVQNVQIPGLQRRSETKKNGDLKMSLKKKARNTSYSMVIIGVIIP
jgi:hypothetical protein